MEYIKDIEIKNFKSIRHQLIDDCRRVNVFIGYPNVGKSNILEALGLLIFIQKKWRTTSAFDLLKEMVRFEKLTDFYYFFSIENPALIEVNNKFSLSLNYKDEKKVRMKLSDKEESDQANIFQLLGGIEIGQGSIQTGQINGIDDFHNRFKDLDELNSFFVKYYKFSQSRIYGDSYSAIELNVPFGTNMFEVISNNSKLKNQFQDLLEPYGFELVVDRGGGKGSELKISFRQDGGIINTIPISLIADTLIRLIYFKSTIYSSKKSVLLFEEPEAHMFPPYISKLTSDIINDENKNQYFITTHSPFVLNDFMEDIDRKDLSVYAVGYRKETRETIIRRISEDEIEEIYQYGVDLFFNLENYLKDAV